MTPPTDPPDVLLIVRPLADPQVRYGHAERDADYRLKLALKVLLRSFGFRCVRVCDLPAGTRPADVRADTGGVGQTTTDVKQTQSDLERTESKS